MVFQVTSTADDGTPNTLRWAIQQANANANNHPLGFDTITFNIGNQGTQQTITLDANRGAFPPITDPGLLINGYSQAGPCP
jgi:hypothetical protein